MRIFRFANPLTYLKLLVSSIALLTNGIQLSELSDENGSPSDGNHALYYSTAQLVAKEGHALRFHVGAKKEVQ